MHWSTSLSTCLLVFTVFLSTAVQQRQTFSNKSKRGGILKESVQICGNTHWLSHLLSWFLNILSECSMYKIKQELVTANSQRLRVKACKVKEHYSLWIEVSVGSSSHTCLLWFMMYVVMDGHCHMIQHHLKLNNRKKDFWVDFSSQTINAAAKRLKNIKVWISTHIFNLAAEFFKFCHN